LMPAFEANVVYRSHLMDLIMDKMVSGLSSSHNAETADVPLATSGDAAVNSLVSCFRGVLQNGCVNCHDVHRLDLMMTAAGPVCYVDQLIHVCGIQ